jgi:hypothetical protein
LQPKKIRSLSKTSYRILSLIAQRRNPTTGEVILDAKKENIADFIVRAELLNLENAGFTTRNVLDPSDPLNNSSWQLTPRGSEALGNVSPIPSEVTARGRTEVAATEDISGVQIVMTCPADFKRQFANLATEESVDILKRLFDAASTEVRLVSPYLDNVIVDRFQNELQSLAKRDVKLRLIFRDFNPQTQNMIQWLKVAFGDNFAYRRIWTPLAGGRGQSARGVHAKFMIIDNHTALVSSMNLTVNSINYNIEIGVLIKDKISVGKVGRIFDILWNNAGSNIAV